MPQVGTGIALANSAFAVFIDGALIARVAGVFDEQSAVIGEEEAVASAACGEDAVHHVDALRNEVEDLFRLADAHEVVGFVLGEDAGDVASDFAAYRMRLADG